jgi:hypothetical protein
MTWKYAILCTLFGFLLGLIVHFTTKAYAHDAMHLSDWVAQGGFRNPSTGEICCGENDCVRLPDEGVAETLNGMFIRESSEVIPFHQVIWKSLDGGWWRCAPWFEGKRSSRTRCLIGPPRSM